MKEMIVLRSVFEKYLKKELIFKNKQILQSNYIPETIFHRDEQIRQITDILSPSLKIEKPSNLFIYGRTGTGKTLTIKYITNNIDEFCKEKNIPVKIIYLNCKLKRIADTEYRLIAQLTREFGKEIPSTGLPTDEVYKIFFSALDKEKRLLLLILDEIDQLVKKTGDEVLYNLTRINEELKNAQVSIIGISNEGNFIDNLDQRVKSSLSEEKIIFPPYNALQIQDILKQRANLALKENILEEGVIEKCSAYAAKEHGDARRALELLRVAAEIAERENKEKIKIDFIDKAEEKIEKDCITEIVKTQPKQYQSLIYSILLLNQNSKQKKNNEEILTGEVYEIYKQICRKSGLRPLTQRRISDIILELDMLGIINATVVSKGRHGRTREISLATNEQINQNIKELLEEGLGLA